jgi:ATP-dependent DNA helicase PIF1
MVMGLRSTHGAECVFVTASTGIAACAIGGVTIHSFAGVGVANEPADALVRTVVRNRAATNRWRVARVLVVDEVSMLPAEMLVRRVRVPRRVHAVCWVPVAGVCGCWLRGRVSGDTGRRARVHACGGCG